MALIGIRDVDQLLRQKRLQGRQCLEAPGFLVGQLDPGAEQGGQIVQHVQEGDAPRAVGRLRRFQGDAGLRNQKPRRADMFTDLSSRSSPILSCSGTGQ